MAGAAAPGPDRFTALVQPVRAGRRVIAAEPLSGGLLHPGWRLSLDDGAADLVLRLYSEDRQAAGRERAVAALVGDTVPVPAFLHLDLAGTIGGQPYALLEWRDGIRLDRALGGADRAGQEAIGRACGALVAAIAAHRFASGGQLDQKLRVIPWPESAAALIDRALLRGPAAALLGAAACRTIERQIRARNQQLDSISAESRLVHGDLRAANVLMAEEAGTWRVAAVLDWEFCHAGSPLLDLGTLLRDRPGRVFSAALGEGYRRDGPALPRAWRDWARLLDLATLGDALSNADPRSDVAGYATDMILGYVLGRRR
jgi:aminoglycoside phosphotransferase (APT) family kinase protein